MYKEQKKGKEEIQGDIVYYRKEIKQGNCAKNPTPDHQSPTSNPSLHAASRVTEHNTIQS